MCGCRRSLLSPAMVTTPNAAPRREFAAAFWSANSHSLRCELTHESRMHAVLFNGTATAFWSAISYLLLSEFIRGLRVVFLHCARNASHDLRWSSRVLVSKDSHSAMR